MAFGGFSTGPSDTLALEPHRTDARDQSRAPRREAAIGSHAPSHLSPKAWAVLTAVLAKLVGATNTRDRQLREVARLGARSSARQTVTSRRLTLESHHGLASGPRRREHRSAPRHLLAANLITRNTTNLD